MFIAGHHYARAHYIGDYGPRDPGGDYRAEHAGSCYANRGSGNADVAGQHTGQCSREHGSQCTGLC